LVPAQAGKVTVGLVSHWPCVTDDSGISTYGLTDLQREMSTPPTLQPNRTTLPLPSQRGEEAELMCHAVIRTVSQRADAQYATVQN